MLKQSKAHVIGINSCAMSSYETTIVLNFKSLNTRWVALPLHNWTTIFPQLSTDNEHTSVVQIFLACPEIVFVFYTANAYLYFTFVCLLSHISVSRKTAFHTWRYIWYIAMNTVRNLEVSFSAYIQNLPPLSIARPNQAFIACPFPVLFSKKYYG